MSDKGHAIVGNMLNTCFDVLRRCSSRTSIIQCYNEKTPRQILHYWQPTPGVTGKASDQHRQRVVAAGLLNTGFEITGPLSYLEALGVLAGVVGVHELGHFSAAALQSIYVKKFAVGFGPILLLTHVVSREDIPNFPITMQELVNTRNNGKVTIIFFDGIGWQQCS